MLSALPPSAPDPPPPSDPLPPPDPPPPLTSLHCPTCGAPASIDVLKQPVQCLFCDAWIMTRAGRQHTLDLGRREARDFGRRLALDKSAGAAAAIREQTETDQLRGRVRRAIVSVVGAPVGFALVAHVGLLLSTMGLRPGPKVLDYEFGVTAGVWLGALLFGHGLLGTAVLASFVLGYLGLHVMHPPEWMVGLDSLTSQSGIDFMLALAVPLGLITAWCVFQTHESLAHHRNKLQEFRGRLLLGLALGGLVGVSVFGGPNLERYLKVHEEGITEHFGELEQICRDASGLSSLTAAHPLEPLPRWKGGYSPRGNGNVQPIVCSRLLASEWGYSRSDGVDVHPGVRMSSWLDEFMQALADSGDRSLRRSTESVTRAAVQRLVDTPYWLALEPRGCGPEDGNLVAMLYSTADRKLVAAVRVPCERPLYAPLGPLFSALSEASGGTFRD